MRRYKRKLMSDINMVPFIDIVLVLLVAFMVVTPFINQGIKVNLPNSQGRLLKSEKDNTLIISIKMNGSYFLNVSKNQEKAISLQDMVSKVKKIYDINRSIVVLVKGDRQVSYGSIISAISSLQKIGITDIGLVTSPNDKK